MQLGILNFLTTNLTWLVDELFKSAYPYEKDQHNQSTAILQGSFQIVIDRLIRILYIFCYLW